MADERDVREEAEPCGCADGAPDPEKASSADRENMKQCADSQESRLPPIDFSTFIVSLSTQALHHLGEVRIPGQEALPEDLNAARQTINILEMLEEKTRGNLSEREARLLSNFLYDLRMRYVRKARERKSDGK